MASPPETPAERADRNFVELLQGFRVAVTGVQVLFAFLLIVPFAPGFAKVDASDRRLFYVSLVSAAIASMLYIAPAAQHRVLFRRGMKEKLVHRANLYGMLGALALAVSMVAATLLVLDYLFDGVLAVVTVTALAVLALWLWFLEPLLRRTRRGGARSSDIGCPPDRRTRIRPFEEP